MTICVAGLWHLGTVTAACLAGRGHSVIAYDDDRTVVARLAEGHAPIHEPGLDALVRTGLDRHTLRCTSDAADALGVAEILWIAWDTPVDENDAADAGAVFERAERLLPLLRPGSLVIVSSQLPVGSTGRLERRSEELRGRGVIEFACCPENLRLGAAIDAFTRPDRVVIGTRGLAPRERLAAIFAPMTDRIEWMSIESAEMAKHALNAFLATSVAFANEIATISERVGADATDVARALRTDPRVGPRAYVRPGASFAGGTLARDIGYLAEQAGALGLPVHLLSAVRRSNDAHRQWAVRQLEHALGTLEGRTIAVWGLTYKAGTNTLRRSDSLALCLTLAGRGAVVRAFDPMVDTLPDEVARIATLETSAAAAAQGADAVVVATEWPQFLDVSADELVARGAPMVLDAGRFLTATLGADRRIRYIAVGAAA